MWKLSEQSKRKEVSDSDKSDVEMEPSNKKRRVNEDEEREVNRRPSLGGKVLNNLQFRIESEQIEVNIVTAEETETETEARQTGSIREVSSKKSKDYFAKLLLDEEGDADENWPDSSWFLEVLKKTELEERQEAVSKK